MTGIDYLKSLNVVMSEHGARVANVLAATFNGLCHLPINRVQACNWSHPNVVTLRLDNTCLASYDPDHLTRLLVLCHQQCVRLEISATREKVEYHVHGGLYSRDMQRQAAMIKKHTSRAVLSLTFHARQRQGYLWERHPTLDTAIQDILHSAG